LASSLIRRVLLERPLLARVFLPVLVLLLALARRPLGVL